jgi:hypothetical protein
MSCELRALFPAVFAFPLRPPRYCFFTVPNYNHSSFNVARRLKKYVVELKEISPAKYQQAHTSWLTAHSFFLIPKT